MPSNTALALAPTQTIATPAALAFEAQNAGECLTLARTLVASRLLPKAIATPEAAFAVIMTGRELGLTAMQSLRSIHIIEGKPTLSADLMVALVRRSPECEYLRIVESTPTVATYETKRRGDVTPTRMSFTIEDAQAAGAAGKDNWRKFPAAMLRARASSALCRAVYSDVMLGVYDPDEIAPANDAPMYVESRTVEAVDVETGEVVDAAAALESQIRGADTAEALAVVSEAVKAATLTDEQRAALRKLYRARKAEIDAARTAREPGEEG